MSNRDAPIKVVKAESIEHYNYLRGHDMITLYEDGKLTDHIFSIRTWNWRSDNPQNTANEYNDSMSITLTIDFAGSIFKREINLKCNRTGNRKIIKIEKDNSDQSQSEHVTFEIEPAEWHLPLLEQINKAEKNFYLSEDELLLVARELLEGKYSYVHFQKHVEISGCIIDGLAFVNSEGKYNAKIIGFEVKSNRDSYKRLYDQLNAYLMICDEVYLVIENKEPPADLPFYVGIIKARNGKSEIMRPATSLRHDIDAGNCWRSLLKNLSTHCGLEEKTDKKILEFFNAVENIKRKLLWNQMVLGWHQTWVKSYIALTDEEKRLVRAFFLTEKEMIPVEPEKEKLKDLIKVMKLDDF